MRKLNAHMTEQTVMFASVLKWIVLSITIGIIIGYVVAFFLEILHTSFTFRSSTLVPYYFLLPFAMVASLFLVRRFAPNAQGHGTEKVIEAVHQRSGKINAAVIPVKLIATVITLFSGGSVGKEGPGAQIGAGAASLFADIFKFSDNDRKKLVICGISAGFASVFGTPIAGAIFGVEVLFIGAIMYDVLLPSMVSGLTAYMVVKHLGIIHSSYNVYFFPQSGIDEMLFLEVLLAGVFFGLISVMLIGALKLGHKVYTKIDLGPYKKAFYAGVFMVILTLIFGEKYLGLGLNVINDSLTSYSKHATDIAWYDSFMKMLFTSVTLSFGGSGGIVTPIFYIGATSGDLFGTLINGYAPLFAAIGFVSVLSGTANAPIAASIMAVELFGIEVAQYAAISCVIAYLITGHRSVYPSQILAMKKSSALDIQTGNDIEHTVVTYDKDRSEKMYRLMRKKLRWQKSDQ
jgi:H+/Cl- antiporter ClcA